MAAFIMAINKININNTDSNYTHSIFDISEYTGKSYDTLSDALADIPDGKKKGGMTVSFILNSDNIDNNYVQYRLMSDTFNTDDVNWQGVDDAPTLESNNLITSNAVFSSNLLKIVFTHYGYINHTGNIETTHAGNIWYHTDLLDINVIDVKALYLQNVYELTTCIAFYDENENFIEDGSITEDGFYTISDFVIPSNAKYVAFCMDITRAEQYVSAYVRANMLSSLKSSLISYDVRINYVEDTTKIERGNLYENFPEGTTTDVYHTDGTTGNYNAWSKGEPKPTFAIAKLIGNIMAFKSSSIQIPPIVYLDEELNFCGCCSIPDGYTTTRPVDINISYADIPSNAKYFCIQYLNSASQNNSQKTVIPYYTIEYYQGLIDSCKTENIYSKNQSDDRTTIVYHEDGTTGTYDSWASSEYYRIDVFSKLVGNVTGFNDGSIKIPSVVYFDSEFVFVGSNSAINGPHDIDINFSEDAPSNAKYFAVQVLNSEYNNSKKTAFLTVDFHRIAQLHLDYATAINEVSYQSVMSLSGLKLYNVGNNITIQTNEFPRNYSAVMYIDNILPSGLTETPDVYFDDNKIIKSIPCYEPPMRQVQGLGSSWETPLMNNGDNIHNETVEIKISNYGNLQSYNIVNRSTLNSAAANKKPCILCIGDSVTFGQNAYFPNDPYKANYTMILQEMFKRDNLQANGGYLFDTIGTISYQRTFTYNSEQHIIKSFNEGYSGTTLQNTGLFRNPKFLDSNDNFSFQNWLNKYRTKDDDGNQLYFDANGSTTGTGGSYGFLSDGTQSSFTIGTEVTNVLDYNVYKPTHVFLFHGSNQAVTKADYETFISYVRDVFPNAIIGLGVPHTSGTYYPKEFPNYVNSERWNSMMDFGYITRQYATAQVLNVINADQSYETDNVFVLPTFFVTPAAKAIPTMRVSEPYNDIVNGDYMYEPKGQAPDVHCGGIAHAAWAYQIYSWLKWTIANNLF